MISVFARQGPWLACASIPCAPCAAGSQDRAGRHRRGLTASIKMQPGPARDTSVESRRGAAGGEGSAKFTSFAFVGHPVARSAPRAEVLRGGAEAAAATGHRWHAGGRSRHVGAHEIGPHTLAITTTLSGGQPPEHPSRGLLVEVADFSTAVRHLQAHDVPFELGPFEGADCFIAVILDPDGNRIGIHQRKAG